MFVSKESDLHNTMKIPTFINVILTLTLLVGLSRAGEVRADILERPAGDVLHKRKVALAGASNPLHGIEKQPPAHDRSASDSHPAKTIGDPTRRLTILHFCDVDELLAPGKGQKHGGLASLKTLVDHTRDQHPQALLLLSGDFLFPSMLATNGKHMIHFLNTLGLDYVMPGNHEFDFGVQILAQRMAESNFTWISSNLYPSVVPLPRFQPYALREVNGLKVGIFSILTEETWELAVGGRWLRFGPSVEVSRQMVKQLRAKGADVIIAMTHMDQAEERELAQKVSGIDIILGGHDHIISKQVVKDSLMVESGADLKVVGRIDYTPEMAKRDIPVRFFKLDASVPQDPTMVALLDAYHHKANVTAAHKIGSTLVPLNDKRIPNRSQETDAMRFMGRSDIAMINSGAIRSDQLYGPGDLFMEDVHRMLPFNNVLVKLAVPGRLIKMVLEHSVSQLSRLKGRFLQVSGISFRVDSSRPRGHRVVSIMVQGRPLNPNHIYTVVTNRYVANGGDGFSMLAKTRRLTNPNHHVYLAEVVSKFIQNNKIIRPSVEGRIVIQ